MPSRVMATRRIFISRVSAFFVVAPAIVRASTIMPVKAVRYGVGGYGANSLLIPSMITKEILAILQDNLIAASKVNAQFEVRFLGMAREEHESFCHVG